MLVQVREEYQSILEALQENVDEAIHHYALEKVQHRLLQAEQTIQRWEQKYGCSYDLFAYRTSTDTVYVNQLENEVDKQDWEGDLFEWEIDAAELAKWRSHWQKLLNR